MFDPGGPFQTFPPPPRRRARRRGTSLHFVEQGGTKFVLKSYTEPDDAPEDAARRLRRETSAIEAFTAAGTHALAPIAGPFETLELQADGAPLKLAQVLVFPFVEAPTLYDAIASSRDPRALIAEAARRVHERHERAKTIEAIHSDGSTHNVFSDWTWFDFCEPHSSDGVRDAKALEVLRLVASIVEVSPRGTARVRVAAFCEAYADPNILALALDFARTEETYMRGRLWLRMLGNPFKLISFLRGNTKHFRRIRTWDALERAVHG